MNGWVCLDLYVSFLSYYEKEKSNEEEEKSKKYGSKMQERDEKSVRKYMMRKKVKEL